MPCTDDVRDEALFGLKVLLIATHPIAFKGGALLLLGKWRITLLFDGWKAHLAVLPTKRKYKMATIEEQIKALEEEIFNRESPSSLCLRYQPAEKGRYLFPALAASYLGPAPNQDFLTTSGSASLSAPPPESAAYEDTQSTHQDANI